MSVVMDELLEFARPKALLLAPAQLQEILKEAARIYRVENESRPLNIVIEAAAELPDVMVDWSRMVQVIVNLIQNAAKHAEGVKIVTLAISSVSKSEVCLRVQDDGAGIAPEQLSRIFEPFYTTGPGTGLGLAIVQRIVKEHGGAISVESEVGAGTAVSICLPVSTAEVAESAEGNPVGREG